MTHLLLCTSFHLLVNFPDDRRVKQLGIRLFRSPYARMAENLRYRLDAHAVVEQQHSARPAPPQCEAMGLSIPAASATTFSRILYCWLENLGSRPWYFFTIARASGSSTAQYSTRLVALVLDDLRATDFAYLIEVERHKVGERQPRKALHHEEVAHIIKAFVG